MKRIALLVVASLLAVQAAALPITLFNTGVDNAGNVLPGGAPDPHWDVVENGMADARVVSGPAGTWIPNNATSKWIWQNASGAPTNVTRTFQTTFDMTGLSLASAIINGRWSADNTGLNIFINGVDVVPPNPQAPGFTTWTGFSIPNIHLVQGLNTLRFEVRDVGVISGFRAEFLTTTANALPPPTGVPDSGSSLVLLGAGLVAIAGISSRRKK